MDMFENDRSRFPSRENCPACGANTAGYATCKDMYYQLTFYTLSHPDPAFFIHQYAVDAYAAQHASEISKPMTIAFALVGLYLFAEKQYTGKQVQNTHVRLAKDKRTWPKLPLPKEKAARTVADVLKAEPGKARDLLVMEWAGSVWKVWRNQRETIENLLREEVMLP